MPSSPVASWARDTRVPLQVPVIPGTKLAFGRFLPYAKSSVLRLGFSVVVFLVDRIGKAGFNHQLVQRNREFSCVAGFLGGKHDSNDSPVLVYTHPLHPDPPIAPHTDEVAQVVAAVQRITLSQLRRIYPMQPYPDRGARRRSSIYAVAVGDVSDAH